MSNHYPISHLPARGFLFLVARASQLKLRLQQRFPTWLGLPIMGPYVQFYRQDDAFKTQLSLFNYFSSFLPAVPTTLTYHVSAYRRDGGWIGSGKVVLAPEQTAQLDLETIIGKKLDAYGLFHVGATAHCTAPEEAAKIGTTTGQFMTIFYPTDAARQSPQLIHSHKLFQNMPIPYSPFTRKPNFSDDVSSKVKSEFFFLNPCRSRTHIRLQLLNSVTGDEALNIARSIPPRGVERIELDQQTTKTLPRLVNFAYHFDRRIAHMKPMLFHHFPDGSITCNHT